MKWSHTRSGPHEVDLYPPNSQRVSKSNLDLLLSDDHHQIWAKTEAKSKVQKDRQTEQTFTRLTFRVSCSRQIANLCARYFHTDVRILATVHVQLCRHGVHANLQLEKKKLASCAN